MPERIYLRNDCPTCGAPMLGVHYHEMPDDAPYCDYCEQTGHTFNACPARDDEYGDDEY